MLPEMDKITQITRYTLLKVVLASGCERIETIKCSVVQRPMIKNTTKQTIPMINGTIIFRRCNLNTVNLSSLKTEHSAQLNNKRTQANIYYDDSMFVFLDINASTNRLPSCLNVFKIA